MLNNRNDLEIKLVDFGLSRMIGESERRTDAWELSKAGAMAYRLRFGDMPTLKSGERMNLAQLCADSRSTAKIPPELLSFMKACVQSNAQACQLKDHAFLREPNKKVAHAPAHPDDDTEDQYDIEASWYGSIVGRDLHR